MSTFYDNCKFSTKDQENNSQNAVRKYKGAWWWKEYLRANLNGWYFKEKQDSKYEGIYWFEWKNKPETLEWTEMKVRPKNYNPSFESNIISY